MRLSISVVALALATVHMVNVSIQDETLVTPQPEHKLLQQLAGQWEFEKKGIPAEGADPDKLGSGTIVAEMVGNFFLVSRWSGKLYEMDYQAIQLLGYDVGNKKYSGTWIDSFMSFRWELTGTLDEKTEELTFTTSGPGQTGGKRSFRERYQFHTADSISIIGEMQRGEQWVSFSTTRLARKKLVN